MFDFLRPRLFLVRRVSSNSLDTHKAHQRRKSPLTSITTIHHSDTWSMFGDGQCGVWAAQGTHSKHILRLQRNSISDRNDFCSILRICGNPVNSRNDFMATHQLFIIAIQVWWYLPLPTVDIMIEVHRSELKWSLTCITLLFWCNDQTVALWIVHLEPKLICLDTAHQLFSPPRFFLMFSAGLLLWIYANFQFVSFMVSNHIISCFLLAWLRSFKCYLCVEIRACFSCLPLCFPFTHSHSPRKNNIWIMKNIGKASNRHVCVHVTCSSVCV